MFPLRDHPTDAVASEPGRRERNRQRTHDALHSAAMRLFAERGYEATSVDDIAAAAGVSVRTFFRYFGTKEDVLFARRMDIGALVDALAAQPRVGGAARGVPSAPTTRSRRPRPTKPRSTSSSTGRCRRVRRCRVGTSRASTSSGPGSRRTLASRAGRSEPADADVLAATIGQTLLDHALTCWMAAGATGDLGAEVDAAFARLAALG